MAKDNNFIVELKDGNRELIDFINSSKNKMKEFEDSGIQELKKKENVVLLVGTTGVGKTTLVNYINNIPLQSHNDDGMWKIVLKDEEKTLVGGFNIGRSTIHSETLFPNIYSPLGKDFSYIDCPGFGDSRGTAIEIANLFFRAAVTEQIANIKLLLVVSYGDLTSTSGRGENFLNSLKDLTNFIGAFDNAYFSSKLQDSIGIVVTQVDNEATLRKEELENELVLIQKSLEEAQNKYDKAPEDFKEFVKNTIDSLKRALSNKQSKLFSYQNARPISEVLKEKLQEFIQIKGKDLTKTTVDVLSGVINKDQIKIFSAPPKKLKDIGNEEKEEILKLINGLRYITREDADIRTIVSEKHAGELINYIQEQNNKLKKEIEKVLLPSLKGCVNQKINAIKSKEDIREIEIFVNNIKQAGQQPKTLEEFLELILPEDVEFLTFKAQDKTVKILVDLLPTQYQNKFGHKKTYMEELQLSEVIADWQNDLKLLQRKPELDFANNELVCNGTFVYLSEICSRIENDASINPKDIKVIKICAFSSFIMDKDFTLKAIQGTDVIVTAPKWNVTSNSKITIDLSAPAQDCYLTKADNGLSPGENGKNGKIGLTGLKGGDFIGIGTDKGFYQLEKVKIISNGGLGDKGQDGGDGADGDKGKDASWFEVKPEQDYLWQSRITRTKDKYYWKEGEKGSKGGDAGLGGLGGTGGMPGQVVIIDQNSNLVDIQKETKQGKFGKAGEDGKPGKGGVCGSTAVKVYHQNDHVEILKSEYMLQSQKYGDAGAGPARQANLANDNPEKAEQNYQIDTNKLINNYLSAYKSFKSEFKVIELEPYFGENNLNADLEVAVIGGDFPQEIIGDYQ